jgi:hypothetical protein
MAGVKGAGSTAGGHMADLEMFICARMALRLTRKGCAALWTSARQKPPAPWDGRAACVGCNVGARNAGQPDVPEIVAAVDAWRRVCPRCRRVSLRMIRGRLCISCYNRDREVRIGHNAKGGRIRLAAKLHPAALQVVSEDGPRTIRLPSVLDLSEVMILAARKATGPLFFTLPAPHWPVAEDRAAAGPGPTHLKPLETM